jgi:hypothetical protein
MKWIDGHGHSEWVSETVDMRLWDGATFGMMPDTDQEATALL